MKRYILGILLILLVCLTGCNLEPMTEEERAIYEASKWHEYEVISVYQYISTRTNNFGAVLDQELKYCFTYIGDDGQLHQFQAWLWVVLLLYCVLI